MYLPILEPVQQNVDLLSILNQIPNIITDKKDCLLTKSVINLPQSEFEYNPTKINYSDTIQLYMLLSNTKSGAKGVLKVAKNFTLQKYYIIDTTFALYKNFWAHRNAYIGSGGVQKRVKQVEVNFYYMIPELIYYITGNQEEYNHAIFTSHFSDVEYLRFGDMLAGITTGIFCEDELNELEEYFNRDKILKEFLRTLAYYQSIQQPLTIDSFIGNDSILIPINVLDNPFKILSYYIMNLLSAFIPSLITAVKSYPKYMHIRSLSDYRYILEVVEDLYLDLSFSFKAPQLPEICVKPKLFYEFDRLKILNAEGVNLNEAK